MLRYITILFIGLLTMLTISLNCTLEWIQLTLLQLRSITEYNV